MGLEIQSNSAKDTQLVSGTVEMQLRNSDLYCSRAPARSLSSEVVPKGPFQMPWRLGSPVLRGSLSLVPLWHSGIPYPCPFLTALSLQGRAWLTGQPSLAWQ